MSRHDTIEESPTSNVPAKTGGLQALSDNLIDPFNRLRSEFDRMFDDFPLRSFAPTIARRLHSFSGPALEFKDKDSEYELVAEVPGMKADDIELKVAEGVLRLSGERKDEREEKGNGFMFSERTYGHFERSIQLPSGVDETKITASATNGLLTVHLPKTQESRQREKTIPIKTVS
jgi:HSP20 family protein